MPLTNVTRESIIDVAGVQDTPLKLVTSYKKLKNEQLYDNVSNSKKLVKQFFGGISPGVNYPAGLFSRGHFSGPL